MSVAKPTTLNKSRLLFLLLLLFAPPAAADNSLNAVNISSRLDFNAILITEVDVIFVYDRSLADRLNISKEDWYRDKFDLLEQEGDKLDVVTVSAPQGFVSDRARLPDRHNAAVRVMVAAYHEAQAVPLHDITAYQRVLVEIDSYGIIVSGQ